MNKLKITKGIFSVGGVASDRVYADGLMIAAVDGVGWEEARENAAMIAETFNIANQTGLTPKQLLEQRDELLEALKGLSEWVEPIAGDNQDEVAAQIENATMKAALEAIAKADGRS